ncbi:MAG: hypothetical protein ACLVH9_05875 [Fusobacterium sp.]|uniref:hypothetical protein n=1 Tax=Fusobacterium sp. TaxID=68766 RepID=UPI00399A4DA5
MSKAIFADIKNLVQEKTYKSKFDFEKYGISEKDKKFIIEREEIILDNAKKHAQSLYEICKAIYEIRLTLKGDESQSFREWYMQNGLTKDKVSELTKRYELYIQAPDKIDFITDLSIPAVKELTRKNIDIDVQIGAIEKGLNNVEEIKEFVASKMPVEKENKPKKQKHAKYIQKLIFFYEDNIKENKSPQELASYKRELQDLEKYIKSLREKINSLEDEKAKENNLKLYGDDIEDAEIIIKKKIFMSEDNKIYTVQKKKNANEFIIAEISNENDDNGKQIGSEWWYCEEVAVKALEEKARQNKWVAV